MQIFTNPQELAAQCKAWHRAGDDIALVPTMTALALADALLLQQRMGLGL